MKNTFGNAVTVTLFGESHGEAIGAVLDGLSPGITVSEDAVKQALLLRRPHGAISTKRVEPDPFQIVSGVYNGKTTGTPITIVIPNTQTNSADYDRNVMRPGHADYTAYMKYHGFEDFRGGGHFSGRVTAALVAAGSIAMQALSTKNIFIGTHISRLSSVSDRDFEDYQEDIDYLAAQVFAVLDVSAGEKMQEEIIKASEDGDSVGGVLETAVIGMPVGVGEPWFDTVEGVLAHGLFSIPGIKGVQFGIGFDGSERRGSDYNDALCIENGAVITRTNRNGGINGGITNGMPILFRCAVKPTPSVFRPQNTIDLHEKKNTVLSLKGRHDPAIIHRARIVVDSITALSLCDLLIGRFGTDYFTEI